MGTTLGVLSRSLQRLFQVSQVTGLVFKLIVLSLLVLLNPELPVILPFFFHYSRTEQNICHFSVDYVLLMLPQQPDCLNLIHYCSTIPCCGRKQPHCYHKGQRQREVVLESEKHSNLHQKISLDAILKLTLLSMILCFVFTYFFYTDVSFYSVGSEFKLKPMCFSCPKSILTFSLNPEHNVLRFLDCALLESTCPGKQDWHCSCCRCSLNFEVCGSCPSFTSPATQESAAEVQIQLYSVPTSVMVISLLSSWVICRVFFTFISFWNGILSLEI